MPYIIENGEKIELERPTIEEPTEFHDYKTTRMHRGKKGAVTYIVGAEDGAAIAKQKVKHWIGSSKKGVGILGIGDRLLDSLCDTGLVISPSCLYSLNMNIADLQIGVSKSGSRIRLGKSRAAELLQQIEKSKQLTLPVFLGALGIDLLGRRRVKLIMEQVEQLQTLDDWLDEDKLKLIPGDATREAVIKGIEANRILISELLAVGVTITTPTPKAPKGPTMATTQSNGIAGRSFCFTGTRECAEEVEELGGVIKTGVSKGLDFLVQKDATKVSNKTQKAESYGTKIISLDTLKAVLAGERDLP